MRILQVMAGAQHGGAETAFVDMCLAMKEAGIVQEVVTRKNDLRVPQLQSAGLKVHTLPLGGVIDIYSPWAIKQIIQKFKPQIVQTWMARAADKTPASPVPKTWLKTSRLGGYYDIKYFKTTDYFETITPDIREYLIREGIAADRVTHINNFAETEKVVTPVTRASLKTPDDATVLLALSRLHINKALDVLIRAVAPLPGVYVWLAGEGPERPALQGLAQELGVEDRVKFLGWRDDRAALLQACDICVFPSRHEPFGTVFVQAWAQRVPLISSLSDGPRQFVKDNEDGLLFPIDDVQALQSCITRLMADKSLQSRLVERGFERYQAEFTKENTVRRYLDHYRDILAREKIS